MRDLFLRVLFFCVLLSAPTTPLWAYSPAPQQEKGQGAIIDEIRIVGAGDLEVKVRSALTLKEGQSFQPDRYRHDVDFLWSRLRVRMERLSVEQISPGHVRLFLYVVPMESFRRVVFLGGTLNDLQRDDFLLLTGLSASQAIDQQAIPRVASVIEKVYRERGYAHAKVEAETNQDLDEVTFYIQEGPQVKIGSIQFVGVKSISESSFFDLSLEGEIEISNGILGLGSSVYDPGALQRDRISMMNLYQDLGYLDAKVWLETPLLIEGQTEVDLIFHVEEGELYQVAGVIFEAWAEGESLRYSPEELSAVLENLPPGAPLEAIRIAADAAAIRRFYGERGHTVSIRRDSERDASFFAMQMDTRTDAEHQVMVVFRIREGDPKRIREVIIEGNTQSQDRIIRREIELEPGDLADMGLAARAQRRLLGTNWFLDPDTRAPSVAYRFEPTEDSEWVNLHFQVKEGRGTGNMMFGGGYNANFGAFLSATLKKSNFDLFDFPTSWDKTLTELLNGEAFTGAGQSLSLFIAPGIDYSQYSFSFSEPDLLKEHVNRVGLNTSLFKRLHRFRTHLEDRAGFRLSVSRRFGRHFSIFGGPGLETASIGRIADGVRGSLETASEDPEQLAGLTKLYGFAGFSWSTVVNPFSPIDSHKVRMEVSRAGKRFGGDLGFTKSDLSFGKYFRVFEDSLSRDYTFAIEGKIRQCWSADALPFTELYWLGGQGSIRGFDYRGIGEVDGYPVGGSSAWNSTMELRFPLFSGKERDKVEEVQWMRGAFFVDAGSFGDSFGHLQPTRVSAGFGLRIRIPFMPQMPLALDFGIPVHKEGGDRTSLVSFTFGEF